MQPAGQPDRLVGQGRVGELRAGRRGVSLGEDQVEHVRHGRDPVRQLVRRRDGERRVDLGKPALGPADPLRHRRLRHEEGPGDLRRAQTRDRAQGERHLRGAGQGRVTAQQQQRQRVVVLPRIGAPVLRRVVVESGGVAASDQLLAVGARPVGAPLVDEAPRTDRDQPAFRVVGHPLDRPLPGRGEQRLLGGVLGGVEVTRAAYERGEDVRGVLPPHVLDRALGGHASSAPAHIAGRSSMTSPGQANRAAICSARSRVSQSIRKKPASCSFVSAYGPSVASGPSDPQP